MRRRKSLQSARCLVTGASSGLGRAFAVELARAGASMVLTGRSQDRLDQTADLVSGLKGPGRVSAIIAADLTIDDDRRRLARAVRDQYGALDLLVNSAGVGANGPFETHDSSVLRSIIDLNVIALAELTRLCLPLLCRGEQPSILNLGSIVARRGLPGRAEYSASKFAVAGFSEAIRAEWAKYGIHVLLLNPGFTNTEFEANLLANTSRYKVTDRRTMTPAHVASKALKALCNGRNEIVLTGEGRLLIALNRLIPRFIDHRFANWIKRLYPDVTLPAFSDEIALSDCHNGSSPLG